MDPTRAWHSGFSVAVAEISGCVICRAGVSHLDGLPRVTKRGPETTREEAVAELFGFLQELSA